MNTALGNQNLTLPAGTQKIGDTEYAVKLNASPLKIEELNDLPVKDDNGAVIYLRDVAYVHDGHPPQTNIVRVNGRRAVLMTHPEDGLGVHARHRRTPSRRGCLKSASCSPKAHPLPPPVISPCSSRQPCRGWRRKGSSPPP